MWIPDDLRVEYETWRAHRTPEATTTFDRLLKELRPIEFKGEDVSLGPGTDEATLQLRQWNNPYDDSPPYLPPVNHLGIDRINFYVKDLTASIKTMNELGYEQLGPIGGSPEFGIVFFYDPDGVKVQLAGPRTN